MKRSTTLMFVKLLGGLSLFTGIIVLIFFIFFFLSPQKTPTPSVPNPSIIPTGTFCGGIAGRKCPMGYICKLSGNYPDAGGTCVLQPHKK